MTDITNASKMLVTLVLCTLLLQADSRFLSSFSVRTSPEDLSVAAAEPRPIFVELEKHPHVLPLVADLSDFSDTPSEASEKVEKILRRPVGFSYRNQHPSSSDLKKGSAIPDASIIVPEESQPTGVVVDQKPAAIDYYKHVKNVENEDDSGAGFVEAVKADEEVEGDEGADKEEQSESIDQSQASEEQEVDHEKIVEAVSKENDDHENVEEENDDKEEYNHEGDDHENYEVHEKNKSNKKYEKGGGKEHHEHHKGSHGEKGDKGYKGHHHDEKGQKGHHIKENHAKEFEEKGGSNKKHHHDDGYHAEHHHGEKGEKGHKFSEEGDHSKGHSTKGEHNIRKKEEYEKKQEFFDESHEEGDFEKDGAFFHEDSFHKGGHEKGGHKKGDHEENHYGKKHSEEKGGHYKEDKGHKSSGGHDSHHHHEDKHGDEESHSGGKKWKYDKGTGGGGGGGHGGGKGGHGNGGGGSHGKYSVHEPSDHEANAEHGETHADIHDAGDDVEKENAEIENGNTELEDDESRIVLERNYDFDGFPLLPKYRKSSKDESFQLSRNPSSSGKLQKRSEDSDEVLIELAKENRKLGRTGPYKVLVLGDYTTPKPPRIVTYPSEADDMVLTSEKQTRESTPNISDPGLAETVKQSSAILTTTMSPIVVKDTSAEASDILIMFIEREPSVIKR
ncbi:unnamed protein product [Phaedon cochleariae]|uniref:Uncharacterized protein n=1 Tax=Phaedon cochleariae TaxID=80249 RepID=A0A9P0GQI4_PHACE|nr:unnamed protein product [Phaedon cochleariae]